MALRGALRIWCNAVSATHGRSCCWLERGACLRRGQSRLAQMHSAITGVFYMPYLSITGMLTAGEVHLRAGSPSGLGRCVSTKKALFHPTANITSIPTITPMPEAPCWVRRLPGLWSNVRSSAGRFVPNASGERSERPLRDPAHSTVMSKAVFRK